MKYDLNTLFYDDEDYINKAAFCNESGKYTIIEAEPDEQNRRRFKIVEVKFSERDLLQHELSNLYAWFEEYDNQVKQYNRCQRLGIEYDKDIEELDNQAKINADRITEIRDLLK